jgi:N-acetyl-anhydromuramyl-L-alanine amidase AmpD
MAICPFALWKPLPQNARTGRTITPRSVALHTTTSGDVEPWKFFASPGANGVESHFWVGNEGQIHQYMDTHNKADCQMDGNTYAISIETADNGARNPDDLSGWTPAQMVSLTRLGAWICHTHSIPAVKVPTWDGWGVGYHCQFNGSPGWNTDHACPGRHKIAQVPSVIANVKAALAPKLTPYWLSLLLEARQKDMHRARTVVTHAATTNATEKALKKWGYPGNLIVDGHYGIGTDEAVKWFQAKVSPGVKPDGILGEKEWSRLAGGPDGKDLFVPELGNYKKWI